MEHKKKKLRGWNENTRFTEEQSVGDVLSRITSRGHIADKFTEVEIVAIYEEIVGKSIAKMTDKLFVRRGKLFIKVSSSALKQELVYTRTKMLNMINEKLKDRKIEEVVLL